MECFRVGRLEEQIIVSELCIILFCIAVEETTDGISVHLQSPYSLSPESEPLCAKKKKKKFQQFMSQIVDSTPPLPQPKTIPG
ncbi:hypothetical protein Patl1_22295 [Pistacia atlantica]|uniref:Uncharacterized protein n=1 Tax=Pistacia atlantica TaxID=434234 RepID=A0ACC0ZXQ7_9ROSI|nr:hypothetical protein Patl1_22295 [Pistacia atlantica]